MRFLLIALTHLLCGLFLLCGDRPVRAQKIFEESLLRKSRVQERPIGEGPLVGRRGGDDSVGPWGHPALITIEGAKKWPADEIRRALVKDVPTIVAAHPLASLANYPTVLSNRVREGYLADGFALATVSGRLDIDAKRIVLTVDEGPQYISGNIQVQGAKAIDAAQLVDYLTHRQPEPGANQAGFTNVDGQTVPRWLDKNGEKAMLDPPIWSKGDSVIFATEEPERRMTIVERAFERQGYRHATFKVSIVRNEITHTAVLMIAIEDEGAPTTIDRFEVTGSERDTPEDVANYLNVKVGQTVTESKVAAWYHKLWLSGRYFKQDVAIVNSKAPDELTTLRIQLVDYKHTSPLRGPLSMEERVMLRHREWLLSAIKDGYALTLRGEMEDMRVEFVAIKDKGAMLLLDPVADKERIRQNAHPIGPMLVAGTPGELLHTYAGGEQLLRAPPGKMQMTFSIQIAPGKPSKNGEQRFGMTTGYGFKAKHETPLQAPVAFSVQIAPVAMVGFLHSGEPKVTSSRGVLTIESDTIKYEIEIETGRLLGLSMYPFEDSPPISLLVEERSLAECLTAIERKLPPGALLKPNAYNAKRPLSSSVDFLTGSPILRTAFEAYYGESENNDNWPIDMQILKKLVASNLLQPIDEWLSEPDRAEDKKFAIPNYDSRFSFNFNNRAIARYSPGIQKAVAWLVLDRDLIFPRDSWPWTLSRGVALYLMSDLNFIGGDLQTLYDSSMGPMGRLITARLVEQMSGEWAVHLAKSGLDKLGMDDFRSDFQPLLDRSKLAGQSMLRAAEMLRACDDEEAKELGRLLLGDDAELMLYSSRFLRERKSEPIEQALPAMLNYLWSQGLGVAVRSRLEDIIERNERLASEKQPETK